MAVLSAVFKGIDELSDMFDRIAERGDKAVNQWDSAGESASDAFAQAVNGAEQTASAAENAASSVDTWTNAIGEYDKSALEAVYTTEDLVEMGYKTQEALEAEAVAVEENTNAMEKGAQAMQEFRTTLEQQAAELDELQEAYMGVVIVMGEGSDEATALKAEISELSSVLEDNQKELEDLEKQAGKTGDEGNDMVKKIEDALTAAALAAVLKEIAEATYAMADAFSEAESVVVKATGATGTQLDSLSASMLKVYSAVDDADMNSTAGAIGEINTRLGLQGEELENVTSLFMQYADNTNSNVVTAVQNVTKVMKNWGVEADGTEGLLDKFTYAAQASGASVDYLSDMVVTNKAMLQQMGYSLDESIALMSMFEYEGLNASSIMTGFRTAINNWSSDGRDATVALQETIDAIANMADETEATALAIDTFGSKAGPELAFAIRNGKFEIDEWVAAVEGAEGTLAATDEAADTLADKWTKASNSMNVAFTGVIGPAVTAVSSALAGFTQGIGDFLNDHPVVVKAITAVGVGLAAMAVYVVAAKVASLAAAPAFKAMGAAIWEAIGPVGLVVAGVTALVAGIAMLVSWIGSQNKEFNELTATSKQHYEQLEDLNTAYEEAAEQYGENSKQAEQLAAEIAGLEAVYESSKMTLEQFVAQNDRLISSHENVVNSFNDSMNGLDSEEKSAQALILKLEQLSNAGDDVVGKQQQMEAIVGKLNTQFPELSLSIDETTGALNMNADAVRALAEAQIEEQRIAKQYETYVDLLADQLNLEEQLEKARAERIAAEERRDEVGGKGWFGDSKQAKKDLEAFEEEEQRLQAALDETNYLLAEHEEAFAAAANASEEAANAVVSYEDGVNRAVQSVASEMNELVSAYDDAYAAARSSIDSTIGLFDTMATSCELSTNDMLAAWQSQVDYLAVYSENLQKAAQYGLDEGLIASLSDGSEESAGYIDAIMNEVGRLEAAGEDTSAFIDNFNSSFQEVETAKDEFAGTIAEMETDFNNKMEEIEGRLEIAIGNMTMGTEAATAAKETIQEYINQITSMTGDAHDAAAAVAAAAASALGGNGISTVGLPGYRGYAVGTASAAEGVAIVGEEGPELVRFNGGETVYTAQETSRILAGTGNSPLNVAVPDNFNATGAQTDKKITLEIAGSGELEVGGSADEDTILDILVANIKPVLLSILRREVFEEGDLSYEF